MISLTWKTLSDAERKEALRRPVSRRDDEFSNKVRSIIELVKTKGDSALKELTERHDRVSLSDLRVSPAEIKLARESLAPELRSALLEAIQNISRFHEAQLPKNISIETAPGIQCERQFVAIERVGLYVPGGTAPLPSTVMMLGVPSKIAGCSLRILCTPPRADGSVDPTILAASDLLGIQEIYKVGGAQAIAAMAFGTESIPKVDKIFGPGNSWVTEAKLQVSQDAGGAAYDLPAGPSEVLVIADESANAAFIASDLLSQAEHGADSQVIFLCTSAPLVEKVKTEIANQLELLPRKQIATEALEKSSLILVESLAEAIQISNDYAPEHLILQINHPRKSMSAIRNAGSVFLGAYTPESVGDYASGTNHVLPTYGFARAYNGLSTESFMKAITFQELTPAAFERLGPTVEVLAQAEQLEAHKNAISIRLATLRGGNRS